LLTELRYTAIQYDRCSAVAAAAGGRGKLDA